VGNARRGVVLALKHFGVPLFDGVFSKIFN
jgi:hypothetical protein